MSKSWHTNNQGVSCKPDAKHQYNDRNCRMQQPQWKVKKKREIKQTETELLNFNLTLTFKDSDSGKDNSDVDFN